MAPDRKRTKSQEQAYVELLTQINEQALWELNDALKERYIPADWHRMEEIAPTAPRKTRLTIRIDEPVVKFYRALGAGWHNRINAVLKSYMLAMLSKEIETSGDRNWLGKPL